MQISDLFRQLSYGELSNLAISGEGSGTIVEAKHPQLIQYTNEALVSLHTRFVLLEKEVIIEQVAEETRYSLTSRFAVNAGVGSGVEHHYIIDQPEDPFTDDIIRVLEVWGTAGKFALNDRDNDSSLFTPTPLLLQVPYPIAGEPLSALYQAKHPTLLDVVTDEVTDLLDQSIELPIYLHNALQQLVAAKTFSHMNGAENIMKSQEYLAVYESECGLVEQRDLANQSWYTQHDKLEQRGFA